MPRYLALNENADHQSSIAWAWRRNLINNGGNRLSISSIAIIELQISPDADIIDSFSLRYPYFHGWRLPTDGRNGYP